MKFEFCNTPLWSPERFWSDDPPVFTKCFENTALIYPVSLYMLLGGIASLYLHRTWPRRKSPLTILHIAKLLTSAALIGLHAWGIYYVLTLQNSTISELISECLRLLNYILVLITQIVDRNRRRRSSIFLSIFCMLAIICELPIYYRNTLSVFGPISASKLFPPEKGEFVLHSIEFPLLVLQFILASITESSMESKHENANKNPIYTSSPLSVALFEFFTSIVMLGYRKTLSVNDLPRPLNDMEAHYCYKKMKNTMDSYKAAGKKVGLVRVILKTYWPSILIGWILEILFVSARVSAFMVLNWLILYMSSTDVMWKGFVYAILICVIYLFSALLIRWGDYIFIGLGLKIKSALTAAIYRKSLTISPSHLGKYTTGELVNLLSVDADKINQFSFFVGIMIGSPAFIGLCTYLLWGFLGPSCFAGIMVIFVMMPLTGAVASISKKVQEAQMKKKDERLKHISEILSSIKIIKFYTWEIPFLDRVQKVRFDENVLLKKFAYLSATLRFFWSLTPFLVSLFGFLAYVLVNDLTVIDANVAFVSLSLFNAMRFSLAVIPDIVANSVQTMVSVRRIQEFLEAEELETNIVGNNPGPNNSVKWKDATFRWSGAPNSEHTLKSVNIEVKTGELVAIVGRVGSGKSSLISSLLGDLKLISGTADLRGSVAYVPQQAWIQNATIKQNILFTAQYSKRLYRRVIECCSLKTDLEILSGGEHTEIGEKGVNLSGGQKQRISLARAVYQNRDVYLLDDPLSAVDAHVGADLFRNVIGNKGMLKGKTRIFVTNQLSVLQGVDRVIVLKDGAVVEQGTYDELVTSGGEFAEVLKEHSKKQKEETPVPEEHDQVDFNPQPVQRSLSIISDDSVSMTTDVNRSRLIKDENVEIGTVKFRVFANYFTKMGWFTCFFVILGFIGARSFEMYSGIWLGEWGKDSPAHEPENYSQRNWRIITYAGLGIFYGIFSFLGTALLANGTVNAARKLHNSMLSCVMKAPMSFFDTTPLGRLLNRFGKDVDQLDIQLPVMANLFLELFCQLIGLLFVISLNVPIFLAFAIPVLIIYILFQRVYMKTVRQIKRLESVTRSPVYNHFSETLNGLNSIRAYAVEDRFIGMSDNKLDITQNCSYLLMVGKLWIGTRLDVISNVIILASNILLVSSKGSIDTGIAAFIASYSMGTTFAFNYVVHYASEVESAIVASERIEEYSSVKSEADWIVEPRPNASWPERGAVSFQGYSTRYREGMDLVLKYINLDIKAQEKVGIVGRTGAGKSSLTLSLFRIIEPATGSLKIDDLNVANIGLHDLRSRLTIIPQEPVLFSGTLRTNLDPNRVYTDEQLWNALECAHIKQNFIGGKALESDITEGGGNLSVGQRQLICLARAILTKKKILVMDEATAAVDLETDKLIQSTIRKDFKDCTIITIAHRLNTILDSDRVVVMSKGEIAEVGNPQELLKNENSQFYSMAKEAGIVEASVAEDTKKA